jgi:exonuclease VII small subunit
MTSAFDGGTAGPRIVTESVDAYRVCKERIDAVEKDLEKALSDTGAQ